MIDELTLLREQRPHTTAPDQRTVTRARRALLHRALEGRRRHRRVIAVGLVAAATLVVGGVVSPWGGGHRRVWLTGVGRRLRGHPDLDG